MLQILPDYILRLFCLLNFYWNFIKFYIIIWIIFFTPIILILLNNFIKFIFAFNIFKSHKGNHRSSQFLFILRYIFFDKNVKFFNLIMISILNIYTSLSKQVQKIFILESKINCGYFKYFCKFTQAKNFKFLINLFLK